MYQILSIYNFVFNLTMQWTQNHCDSKNKRKINRLSHIVSISETLGMSVAILSEYNMFLFKARNVLSWQKNVDGNFGNSWLVHFSAVKSGFAPFLNTQIPNSSTPLPSAFSLRWMLISRLGNPVEIGSKNRCYWGANLRILRLFHDYFNKAAMVIV